jgi:hypothetical protein
VILRIGADGGKAEKFEQAVEAESKLLINLRENGFKMGQDNTMGPENRNHRHCLTAQARGARVTP